MLRVSVNLKVIYWNFVVFNMQCPSMELDKPTKRERQSVTWKYLNRTRLNLYRARRSLESTY